MNSKSKALNKSKAPTPFKMIGSGVKRVGRGVGRVLSKSVNSLMAPEVNRLKIQDKKMKEMDREAKAGEFN